MNCLWNKKVGENLQRKLLKEGYLINVFVLQKFK